MTFAVIAGETPPKKKRRAGNTNSAPGVAQTYLQENFGSFPTTAVEVRNGHILYVYMTSGEFSRAECDRQLRTLITNKLDFISERCYKADIKRIVSSTLEKYRNLGNPEQVTSM